MGASLRDVDLATLSMTPINWARMDDPKRQRQQHFTFKRFRIDQADCAMKVSSDACILGAMAPTDGARRILDIGTGTGLLALMMAQRAARDAVIDAVEIDGPAAARAQSNVSLSPFASMIRVHPASIQTFVMEPHGPPSYDLIVANPPFYERAPRSLDARRRLAFHSDEQGLDFSTLLSVVARLLADRGQFWVLLPAVASETFAQRAWDESGLYSQGIVTVRHKPGAPVKRVIRVLGREPTVPWHRDHCKCDTDGSPSTSERALLGDYLLYFPGAELAGRSQHGETDQNREAT